MKKFWITSLSAIAALSLTGTVLAAQSGILLNKQEVKEKALTIQEGYVEEIDLEYKQGVPVYEIDIEHAQGDTEIKIDAVSGEVLAVQKDNDESSKSKVTSNNTVKTNAEQITKQQAIDIALKNVQGKVIEVELDKEDGLLIYVVEILNEKVETEIEIDAYSGEILHVDNDDTDDDRYDD